MTTTVERTEAQWRFAGLLVREGFSALSESLNSLRTDGRHRLEDAILDQALMDAGIIERDPLRALIANLRDEWEEDPRIGAYIRPA